MSAQVKAPEIAATDARASVGALLRDVAGLADLGELRTTARKVREQRRSNDESQLTLEQARDRIQKLGASTPESREMLERSASALRESDERRGEMLRFGVKIVGLALAAFAAGALPWPEARSIAEDAGITIGGVDHKGRPVELR